MNKYKGEIVELSDILEHVRYCKIRHIEPDIFEFQAGQYFTIRVGKGLLRAYSIATYDTETGFVETYVDTTPGGPGSKFFENAKVGDEVEYMGPSGRYVYENNTNPSIFISTGTGLVPHLSMTEKALRDKDAQVYLLQGYRSSKDIILEDRMREFAKNENFSYDVTLSREKKQGYKHGRVTAHLKDIVDKYTDDITVYICGWKVMIADVESQMIDLGVDPDNIKYEKYY